MEDDATADNNNDAADDVTGDMTIILWKFMFKRTKNVPKKV